MICPTVVLAAHLWTIHAGDREYQEKNYGAAAECRSGDFIAQAGVYRNSFNNTSVYGVAGWEPLHLGPVHVGAAIGLASGYSEQFDQPIIGGARVRVEMGRVELSALLSPKTRVADALVHVMVGWRVF